MAGCPVVADDADVGRGAAGAFTCCRQEHSTCGLHDSPSGGVVDIGGVAAVGIDESDSGRAGPVVGQQDIAGGAFHGGHTLQVIGIGALGQQVGPFAVGKRTPHGHLVAAVDNGVVVAPVGVGIEVNQVVAVGSLGILGVVGSGLVGHETACAAIPAASAIAEQVDPRGAVSLHEDVVIVATGNVVLVNGKAPGLDTGSVLQIALREVDSLVGAHTEDTGQGTLHSGVFEHIDAVVHAVDDLLIHVGDTVDAVVEGSHLGSQDGVDISLVHSIQGVGGIAEILNLAIGVVVDV